MEYETIQSQRASERQAAAMKIAPPKANQVAALRSKAAKVAAEAEAVENSAIQAYAALENLLERRATTLSDGALYRRLATDVETSNSAARAAAVQLVRANDLVTRQSALMALDSLTRTAVLAPLIPMLLEEYTATAAELGKQILAVAREHGIDLQAACSECQINAANESPPDRCARLTAGFTGLIK